MSVLGDVQAYNVTFAQELAHTQHGEGPNSLGEGSTIFFERLSGTNEPTQSAGIDHFKFYDRAFDGTQLPPEVKYEIRIPEDSLTSTDLLRVSSLTLETPIATTRYSLVKEHFYPPFGECRLWRLGVAPKEDED